MQSVVGCRHASHNRTEFGWWFSMHCNSSQWICTSDSRLVGATHWTCGTKTIHFVLSTQQTKSRVICIASFLHGSKSLLQTRFAKFMWTIKNILVCIFLIAYRTIHFTLTGSTPKKKQLNKMTSLQLEDTILDLVHCTKVCIHKETIVFHFPEGIFEVQKTGWYSYTTAMLNFLGQLNSIDLSRCKLFAQVYIKHAKE